MSQDCRCVSQDQEKVVVSARAKSVASLHRLGATCTPWFCMPRLIPRLLKAIARGEHLSGKYSGPLVSSRPRQRPSLWRPTKTSYDFTLGTRTRSFLLNEENPVIAPDLYRRHKKLPPSLQLKDMSSKTPAGDEAREMSEEERSWWASPYRACSLLSV
jgi:hypothetical protein